ncbi:uncharacterized protein LOC120708621 isoform X3 [Panicum virgatum]|uniref:uncharacterized protein LOC120708621 isoform X3 n=1 Tax=Panicum virgatum TaxID=38727 RepID=UPI0019D5740F|nr:uncharacterized protein LOC120708621 isoform X3 [Panicum virgatum]
MLSDGSDGEWGEKRRALVRHSGEWRFPSADGSGELQFPSDPLRRGVESRDARLGGSFRSSDALEFFFIWRSVDRKLGCVLNDVCSSKGDNEFVWVDTMLTDAFRRGSILQAENLIDLNVPWESERDENGPCCGIRGPGHSGASTLYPVLPSTGYTEVIKPIDVSSTTKKRPNMHRGCSSVEVAKKLHFTPQCEDANEVCAENSETGVNMGAHSCLVRDNRNLSSDKYTCGTENRAIAYSATGNEVFDLNVDPAANDSARIGNDTTLQTCASSGMAGAIVALPNDNQVSWKRRKTICEGPDYRDPVPGKPSALQQALMKFADRTSAYIINPAVGTEFDNCDEAYEYYNLYSWECGFGIRWGKKRWSEKKRKKCGLETKPYQLAQEFYCSCRGHPESNVKTCSSKTNCRAMLRLHRTADHGWIVVEHMSEHNHPLS